MTAPTAPTGHDNQATGQPRSNRRFLWGVVGLFPQAVGYGIAIKMQDWGWVTPLYPLTVLWCALPYLLSVYWLRQVDHLPPLEQIGFLLVITSAAFLLAPLAFALAQAPYSRGAVLLAYVLALVWHLSGHMRWGRRKVMYLAYLDPNIPYLLDRILRPEERSEDRLKLINWTSGLPAQEQQLSIDGVVLNRHGNVTILRQQCIRKLKLQRVPLYSLEIAAEMLSGRKIMNPTGEKDLWQLSNHPGYDITKRMLDICLALITIPLWVPLCLFTGVIVKIDSSGPMLYSQWRVGRHGRVFRIWKVRSMRHEPHNNTTQFAMHKDDRITHVGRFIRRTRIDELPQLWNVIKGDMSLIGPRPEQTQFANHFSEVIPTYAYRHLVRPGLTGWAQVQQGYADNAEQTSIKLSYDLYYVAHYSFALDLLIAYKTIRIIITGFGSR